MLDRSTQSAFQSVASCHNRAHARELKMLNTERLLLRPWEAKDLESFARMNADPRVMEFFPKLLTKDEVEQMIQRIQKHIDEKGFGLWAAELKETRECVGFVGLQVPAFETHFTPCVEIGWRLSREVWGKGLAVEGARSVLEDAFGRLKMSEVLAMASKNNLRSRRVMDKLGMHYVPEYDFEHPKIAPGSPIRECVTYRITAQEFFKG